jgi:hypothetical protein
MLIIWIGWPLSPSSDLKLPFERFTSLSDGSAQTRADAVALPVSGQAANRLGVGAANLRHFRPALAGADVSA